VGDKDSFGNVALYAAVLVWAKMPERFPMNKKNNAITKIRKKFRFISFDKLLIEFIVVLLIKISLSFSTETARALYFAVMFKNFNY
jgi:hypothetical protein